MHPTREGNVKEICQTARSDLIDCQLIGVRARSPILAFLLCYQSRVEK